MSHRGDRYRKKYIQCNFIYRLSLQPWVSRCARGTVPWVHRDTRLATEPTVFTAVFGGFFRDCRRWYSSGCLN